MPVDLDDWNHQISHGKVTQSLVMIDEDESAGSFVARKHNNHTVIGLVVVRGDERLPLHKHLELTKGDQVLTLVAETDAADQKDRFDDLVEVCPILDLSDINSAEDFFEMAAEELSANLGVSTESLAESFLKSETWSSTVVAPGMAIPHILLTGSQPFQILIARSVGGIHFPAQDDPVRIIFVLAGAREDRNFHLRALSAIAQIAQDPSFERKWMAAKDTESLRQLILTTDRRRFPVST